jgi:hypothetical protein
MKSLATVGQTIYDAQITKQTHIHNCRAIDPKLPSELIGLQNLTVFEGLTASGTFS